MSTTESRRRSRRAAAVLAAAALVVGAGLAAAQVTLPWPSDDQENEARQDAASSNVPYDGRFVFVRLRYEPGGGRRSGFGGFGFRREPPWSHDYPRAERHFMKILKELTYLTPYMEGGNIITLDDPSLFNFPIAYMCEPGYWTLTDQEAANLRAYLLKGGFVIFDDFRGYDWDNFQAQMARVLPQGRFVELDATHPIFHSFFEIGSLEFVQYDDRGQPIFYGIFEDNDPKKRLMVIANYNNDIGEYLGILGHRIRAHRSLERSVQVWGQLRDVRDDALGQGRRVAGSKGQTFWDGGQGPLKLIADGGRLMRVRKS